jgi:hypothetical protein
MLRIALIDIVMFSLPFLVYGAYMLLVKRMAPADVWQTAPYLWLIVTGVALVLIAMAVLISFTGGKPGGTYRPTSFENGVIRPGTIE